MNLRYCLTLLFTGFVASSFAHANPETEQLVARIYLLKSEYTNQLHPYHDPFSRVYDLEHGNAIFMRMKLRPQGDSFLPSPLARVLDAITTFHAAKSELDLALVQSV